MQEQIRELDTPLDQEMARLVGMITQLKADKSVEVAGYNNLIKRNQETLEMYARAYKEGLRTVKEVMEKNTL